MEEEAHRVDKYKTSHTINNRKIFNAKEDEAVG